MTQEFYIENDKSGQRLDKFLVALYPQMTRGDVIRLIRSGAVEINGKKAKASYTTKGGEYIFIGDHGKKSQKLLQNHTIPIELVDVQEDFIVINKQIGVQVHPSHRERKNTIVNAVIAIYPEIMGVGDDADRPGIMHRLDKDTSGLMVIARNQKAYDALKKAFQEKQVQKTYHALVFGNVQGDGVVDAPIARATSYTKQKIAFGKYAGEAKEAQSAYRKIDDYRVGELDFSLVEVRPYTGRMHQIRVHMAHIGHPLLGDQRYYTKIERRLSLSALKNFDIHTFFLHAKELSFVYEGRQYMYTVDYPERFKALVRFLRK